MIVGAVAGMAALAVVLVQRLIDDTGEGVAGGGVAANRSAAEVAAGQIEEEARTVEVAPNPPRFATWNEWDRYFTARCSRLEVLYSTIDLKVEAGFDAPFGEGDKPMTAQGLTNAGDQQPNSSGQPARILCKVQ